jgi:hypothetical protein
MYGLTALAFLASPPCEWLCKRVINVVVRGISTRDSSVTTDDWRALLKTFSNVETIQVNCDIRKDMYRDRGSRYPSDDWLLLTGDDGRDRFFAGEWDAEYLEPVGALQLHQLAKYATDAGGRCSISYQANVRWLTTCRSTWARQWIRCVVDATKVDSIKRTDHQRGQPRGFYATISN